MKRPRVHRTGWLGSLTLLTVSLVVSLSVGEMVMRALTPFPISTTSNQRRHEELLYVNAGLPDLDALGFRNRSEPRGHRVFAIGDSHTFGFNVSREHAWPQRLEEISGLSVYNFGAGGYNVYQYYRLFQLALSYGARVVIVALYPANDVEPEACRVLALEYWQRVVAEVGLAVDACGISLSPPVPSSGQSAEDLALHTRLRRWLTAEVALASALYLLVWDPMVGAIADQGEDADAASEILVPVPEFPSVGVARSSVKRHRMTTDLARPIVRQHFENSLRLFSLMGASAETEGVSLSIMVIPSRERVIADWAEARGYTIPPELAETRLSEEELTRRYLDSFREWRLRALDLGPRLVDWFDQELARGAEAYPAVDGHPMESGYLEYARGAAVLLSAEGSGTVN